MLALSVDASRDELHAAEGRGLRGELARGCSSHLRRMLDVLDLARELGFVLKLNIVVSRATLEDDMAPLVLRLQPSRWKVFQNGGSVEELLISGEEFAGWVARHRTALGAAAAAAGGPEVPLVAEANEDMWGSYAMLDPACRFFSNASGTHVYGPGIFSPVVPAGDAAAAWAGVGGRFAGAKFVRRGGVYDWGQGPKAQRVQRTQCGAAPQGA